ncbi:MAG: hypothetical protein ACFFCI_17870 [Promethearchaeota archaeon]
MAESEYQDYYLTHYLDYVEKEIVRMNQTIQMNNFEKHKFAKLKPEIIQQILEYEEKYHSKIGGDYYIGSTKDGLYKYKK